MATSRLAARRKPIAVHSARLYHASQLDSERSHDVAAIADCLSHVNSEG